MLNKYIWFMSNIVAIWASNVGMLPTEQIHLIYVNVLIIGP